MSQTKTKRIRWTKAERIAWRPPERICPSEWAERYRVLPDDQSKRAGPWRHVNAPYLTGLMDVCAADGVVEVNIMKASQAGVSEAVRNVMGYWMTCVPAPIGLTLPSKDTGASIITDRIIPMLHATSCLRELVTNRNKDLRKTGIKLRNNVRLRLMWSGSASSLASHPIRFAVCDEVDKFDSWAGKEADPVSLVKARLRTYEDQAKQINISSPTTRAGRISQLYEESTVKLHYAIRCPHCNALQRPVFDRVRWPKLDREKSARTRAHLIESQRMAYYLCDGCDQKITEDDKAWASVNGAWRDDDGNVVNMRGPFPRETKIGLHLPAFACQWCSWSKIAADFIRAEGDPSALFVWRTNTLGEPMEDQLEKPQMTRFMGMFKGPDEGIAPQWASVLIGTIDTQHDHFWGVVRAWGGGLNSQLVWQGRLNSFDELDTVFLRREWPIAGLDGRTHRCDWVGIDSGGTKLPTDVVSRTMEVYQWVYERMNYFNVHALKGATRARGAGVYAWKTKAVIDAGPMRGQQLLLTMLDTQHWQDVLHKLYNSGKWRLNGKVDQIYAEHMSNMHKTSQHDRRGVIEMWRPISTGVRVDLRDCEVYQVAAAYDCTIHLQPEVAIEDEKTYAVVPSSVVPPVQPKQPDRRFSGGSGWAVTRFK